MRWGIKKEPQGAHGSRLTAVPAPRWAVPWARCIFALVLLLCGLPSPARAHESEQYSLPVGRDFAELGPHFTQIVHAALVAAVADANRSAAQAGIGDDPLQAADFIAARVWERLFLAFPTNELLDASLSSATLQEQYPGLVTLHWPASWIYDDPVLLLDVSKFVRTFFRAGTVSANGIPFGTDKIIHFVNLGRIYHVKYIAGLQQGLSPEQATAEAIAATSRNPLTSENGLLGLASTGIRSNGDLAANYAGLLFYRNLSEPVRIGDRIRPPLLLRDGDHWQVLAQPDGDFFTAYITPHWNEVLNPNTYLAYVGERVREQIHQRCGETLDNYRDLRGRLRSQAQFAQIEIDLARVDGSGYDHEAEADAEVSVAAICFDPSTAADAPPAGDDPADGIGSDALGRTPLWWAARLGRPEQAAAMSLWPAQLNQADVDGETPLHAATRAPGPAMLQWLLAHGADPNPASQQGMTPLLLAAGQGNGDAAAALLKAGADPDRQGPFGATALHLSVMRGHTQLTDLLLATGARPTVADDLGNTALHMAAAHGDARQAQRLLAAGADPDARNAWGARPSEEARRQGHDALARRLATVHEAPFDATAAPERGLPLQAAGMPPAPGDEAHEHAP